MIANWSISDNGTVRERERERDNLWMIIFDDERSMPAIKMTIHLGLHGRETTKKVDLNKK